MRSRQTRSLRIPDLVGEVTNSDGVRFPARIVTDATQRLKSIRAAGMSGFKGMAIRERRFLHPIGRNPTRSEFPELLSNGQKTVYLFQSDDNQTYYFTIVEQLENGSYEIELKTR